MENRASPDGFYVVNLNDSTWSSSLGRNITTLTFPMSPRHIRPELDDNRVFATLRGVESAGDSTGSVIDNPADVIEEYLLNAKLMGLASTDLDTASFTAAKAALTGKVGWAQIEAQQGLQVIQEIARQCHSVLFFDQGKVFITVLSNTPGTSIKTFDVTTNDNILLGSLAIAESSVDDIINELTVKWRRDWDDIRGQTPLDIKAVNSASVTAFGKKVHAFDLDLYTKRTDAEAERDFWLARWNKVWRIVRFAAFHDALQLQPGDEITVTYVDGEGRTILSAQKMWVLSCVDTGLQGLVEIEARYIKYAY